MLNIKSYIPEDFCITCLGCCRYNCNPSMWSANIMEEERRGLNLDKLELIAYKDAYICPFLNPEDNLCRIYKCRPLECRLYPFLLNRQGQKIYLALDLNCKYISEQIMRGLGRKPEGLRKDKAFQAYLDYLKGYFHKPKARAMLKQNLSVFSSYPMEGIITLCGLGG